MNRNSRIFLILFGKPFLRRLAWPLGLLLFAVSQADATVNWTALRDRLESRDPWQVALLVTMLYLSWGITAGRALRVVWRQPVFAFLVRQPLSRGQWVGYLAPSLFVTLLPVAGICWLAPQHAPPVLHYFGFVGLAWPIILGASYRGRSGVSCIAVGTAAHINSLSGYRNGLYRGLSFLHIMGRRRFRQTKFFM